MNLLFTQNGWKDYLYWQSQDKKILKKINELIDSVLRDPFEGIGKPEPLKWGLQKCWSRRIDQEHRLVYAIYDKAIHILSCRYHY